MTPRGEDALGMMLTMKAFSVNVVLAIYRPSGRVPVWRIIRLAGPPAHHLCRPYCIQCKSVAAPRHAGTAPMIREVTVNCPRRQISGECIWDMLHPRFNNSRGGHCDGKRNVEGCVQQ